ncbi:MAG: hypothetical protein ACE5OZ_24275 [Candidatus Heimdallarchaeota archaeon]
MPSIEHLQKYIAARTLQMPINGSDAEWLADRLEEFYIRHPWLPLNDHKNIQQVQTFRQSYIVLQGEAFSIHRFVTESKDSYGDDLSQARMRAINKVDTVLRLLWTDIDFFDSIINRSDIKQQIELIQKQIGLAQT